MRIFTPLLLLLPLLTTACGPGGSTCFPESVSYCAEYETPDTLVMEGFWTGSYDAGHHHLLYTNEVMMTWQGDAYELRVEREGAIRYPFFRTAPFHGYGPLFPDQASFFASYSPWEAWEFRGGYYTQGSDIVFSGNLLAEGDSVGSFQMRRRRLCVREETKTEDVCIDWTRDYDDDVTDTTDDGFAIARATLAPNPVTAGTHLGISAEAQPAGGAYAWEIRMTPVTAPTDVVGNWSRTGTTFSFVVSAPTQPGDYTVSFSVDNGEETREVEQTLTVTP